MPLHDPTLADAVTDTSLSPDAASSVSAPMPIGPDLGTEITDAIAAVLDVVNRDTSDSYAIDTTETVRFTWDYERSRPALSKLYEKAKRTQWNATTDLDWSQDVDVEALARLTMTNPEAEGIDLQGLPFAKWSERDWLNLEIESQNWMLSQFLHGEEGALICTARIVTTVPFIDAKYYASTQVMDEARHVEVFARYLHEKLTGSYPINLHLRSLLDDILRDSRWDITYLGMQIMVEGLALAAFGFLQQMTEDPLLKNLLRYVMSDEARHVAFGVLSLQEAYQDMTAAEIRERQEFAFDAAVYMRDRFLSQEVWERVGVSLADGRAYQNRDPKFWVFKNLLFSKIVPNCRKLGLLDAGDGWLRQKFAEIDVIQFESWTDTTEEYGSLQTEVEEVAG